MKVPFVTVAAMLLAGCVTATPAALSGPETIRGVNAIGITVSDIDDTLAFYQGAVPYELVERRRVPAASLPAEVLAKRTGEIEIALVRTPTVFLQLTDIDPERRAPPALRPVIGPGYTHICFQTLSATPGYDKFRAQGLRMLSRGNGPVDLGGYGVTYAYGFDPDGIMIEMEQLSPKVVAAGGEFSQRRARFPAWISHIANVPGDKARMVEFYTKLLGYGPRRELVPTRRSTFDQVIDLDNIEVSASWFDTGNIELEFWHYHEPTTPTRVTRRMIDEIGYSGPIFEVSDLAGTGLRLEREGVRFVTRAFELGGWKMRYARDPEGNLLAFAERTSAPAERSIERMRDIATYRGIGKPG